jgi:hypothetical protein
VCATRGKKRFSNSNVEIRERLAVLVAAVRVRICTSMAAPRADLAAAIDRL